eukprot:1051112-Rhodomonas_salina.2
MAVVNGADVIFVMTTCCVTPMGQLLVAKCSGPMEVVGSAEDLNDTRACDSVKLVAVSNADVFETSERSPELVDHIVGGGEPGVAKEKLVVTVTQEPELDPPHPSLTYPA